MEKAQQQIDHGRFAGAGAADQSDLLAGLDCQIEILQHAGLAAVAEADVLEIDTAGADRQRLGAGRVGQLQRLRDGQHALLHHADILEDLGDAHGDLPRHIGELQRQRQHHGDGADLDRAVAPQHERQRARSGDQQRIEHVEHAAEDGEQALRGNKQIDVAVDRVAHVLVLFAGAGEQLYREDIGVAVDDAPHQRRARDGADLRALAHARHEIIQAARRSRQTTAGSARRASGRRLAVSTMAESHRR